jgi:DNA-binding beta-propeller fold protein YncE
MGTQRGQFWLPAGLAVDAQNRIYVADQYNKRINIYQYLSQATQSDAAPDQTERAPAN